MEELLLWAEFKRIGELWDVVLWNEPDHSRVGTSLEVECKRFISFHSFAEMSFQVLDDIYFRTRDDIEVSPLLPRRSVSVR